MGNNIPRKELEETLFGKNDKELNAVESLINIMRGPIVRRKGLCFPPDECSAWADELENYLKEQNQSKQ